MFRLLAFYLEILLIATTFEYRESNIKRSVDSKCGLNESSSNLCKNGSSEISEAEKWNETEKIFHSITCSRWGVKTECKLLDNLTSINNDNRNRSYDFPCNNTFDPERTLVVSIVYLYINDSFTAKTFIEIFNASWVMMKDKQNISKEQTDNQPSAAKSYSNLMEKLSGIASISHIFPPSSRPASNISDCYFQLIYVILPYLQYIAQFPIFPQLASQFSPSCRASYFIKFVNFQSNDSFRIIQRLVDVTKKTLETHCLSDGDVSRITSASVLNVHENDNNKVTILVPIVIICFIVFSCVLIMRFCQDGESSLMMQAKIMKYHPEKDKQLLAVICQQIYKDGQSQFEEKSCIPEHGNSKRNSTNRISLSNKRLLSSQPCCSRDVISCPLVSTIACGMAPLKQTVRL